MSCTIDAIFWSPWGNLIIHAKKVIPLPLRNLLIRTISRLAGGDNSFVILDRPPLSLLKILLAELSQELKFAEASF